MSVSREGCALSGRQVSSTGRSIIQRTLAECGVAGCDLVSSKMRKLRATSAVES
jgi:hypothetical protein